MMCNVLKQPEFSCRVTSEDNGVLGLRFGSTKLSFGATVMPFACKCQIGWSLRAFVIYSA